MKKAVIIIVILGVIANLFLGIKWISDYNDYKSQIEAFEELASDPDIAAALKEVEATKNASYALIACGVVALVAVFLAKKIGPKIAGIIIVLSGVIPGILASGAFLFTSVLILGGILALVLKPKEA